MWHAGYQRARNHGKFDYADWKIDLIYDLHRFEFGAVWVGTDVDEDWYCVPRGGGTEALSDNGLVLSISSTF